MIPVEPQKEGNTISYFSSYSISAINLVTTIDKKLVTVKENKRVYVIIHTRSSRPVSYTHLTVIKIVPIDLDMKDRTPLSSRNAPAFKSYFNLIWKELNQNA